MCAETRRNARTLVSHLSQVKAKWIVKRLKPRGKADLNPSSKLPAPVVHGNSSSVDIPPCSAGTWCHSKHMTCSNSLYLSQASGVATTISLALRTRKPTCRKIKLLAQSHTARWGLPGTGSAAPESAVAPGLKSVVLNYVYAQ